MMKKLSCILAITLSMLIIYSGVGVSIMHYCCARCETVQSCCADDGCHKCKKDHESDKHSSKSCKDKGGCTATVYKVDLAKYAAEQQVVTVPVITLFCQQLSYLLTSVDLGYDADYTRLIIPPPPCPRQMLALHSVLII